MIDVVHLTGHRVGETIGEGVAVLRGMILWFAPACRVTAHFGPVRIVNFLQKITEMPGCERSL